MNAPSNQSKIQTFYDRDAAESQPCLYRASGGPDEDGTVSVWCMAYAIIRRTPCGVWISRFGYDKPKFVNLQANRKWAHETTAEALRGLRYRKEHQIRICENQITCAKMTIDYLDDFFNFWN